jgi:glycerol-3-phosphate dehydrogenase
VGDADVLVIGGGITGAGIALDAVSRGLRTVLLERDDLASGTTSKSSKLVHGGLRYLEQREFGLVYEGVRERNLLRRNIGHLVRPLGFVVPTPSPKMHAALKAGLTVYDAMATGRNVRTHRRLSTRELLVHVPGLVNGIGLGGYRYYDCQTDDARLALCVAQAASRRGAMVVNHAKVDGFLRFGERVVGVTATDLLSGQTVEITARWVVSATGVWADDIRGLGETGRPLLTPSKGIHLAFDSRAVRIRDAALIRSGAGDGRLVFVIPWGSQVIVGTTDDHYDGDLGAPDVAAPDAAYLLHAVNESFGTTLRLDDVIGAWAGLRPLLSGSHESAASRDLSRRHAIFERPPGLITITGGKLTTYRQMAEDVVDQIVAHEGGRVPCVTERLVIGPSGDVADAVAALRHTCEALGIDPDLAPSLVHRHGLDAPAVAAFCADRGEGDRLLPTLPYLRGEVRWAVRHEMARTLDDVLQRRLRVSLRHREAGGPAVTWVAGIMAEELGWDDRRREDEVRRYFDAVERERGVVPLDRSWTEADQILRFKARGRRSKRAGA